MKIKYFFNGVEIQEKQAKEQCKLEYFRKGHADLAEFEVAWSAAKLEDSGEEYRDMIFEWSDYSLEIEVNK